MSEETNEENFKEEFETEEKYYEKAFDHLEKTGKHTWNWAAFLFGELWMAYRKMYLYTLFVSIIIYSI